MIRELRESDAAGVVRLIREVIPNWVTSERGFVHRLRTNPEQARRQSWVAEADGELVGWASAGLEAGSERDDVASLGVRVRPGWRGRGIGRRLYEPAWAHVDALGARKVLAEAADEPAARRFLESRGFRHTMTHRHSRLEVRPTDAELRALAAEKEAEGFTLAAFADFADRPELIHAVAAEAALDEPADEPQTRSPLEWWLARAWAAPDLARDGSFIVVHDGRPVTLTELHVDAEGGRAGNGFTGTLRAYRGRGLARLAKLASIDWAARNGIATITTANDETNAPMLAVNTRLGYQPFGAWLAYVREPA